MQDVDKKFLPLIPAMRNHNYSQAVGKNQAMVSPTAKHGTPKSKDGNMFCGPRRSANKPSDKEALEEVGQHASHKANLGIGKVHHSRRKQTLQKQIMEFGQSIAAQERAHALSGLYHARPLRGIVQGKERTPESQQQQQVKGS